MEIGPAKATLVSKDFALIVVAVKPEEARVVSISPRAPPAPTAPPKLKAPIVARERFALVEEFKPPTKAIGPEPASRVRFKI